jgi:hypothetical protein
MSPIGRKKCMLELVLHRLKCRGCSTLWWPTLPFMVGTHRYVRSFALTVIEMLRFSTIHGRRISGSWVGSCQKHS